MPPAAGAPADSRARLRVALLLGGFALLLATWAATRGISANWDLRNYHLYSPWAWLNDRLDRDVAPAHLQSYFNPMLHLPTYAMVRHLPGPAVTFVLALLQALVVFPLYALARRCLADQPRFEGRAMAFAVAIAGTTGATQLGELGATQGDNLLSLPLLVGLAAVLRAREAMRVSGEAASPGLPGSFACGAFLFGMVAGLKLTLAPIAFAAVLASCLPIPGRRIAHRLLPVGALAAIAGFALAAGPWMIEMFVRFGNPLFPQFASVWPDAIAPPYEVRDERFLPRSALEAFAYPITWALDPKRTSELGFLDLRVPLLYLSLLLPWWRPWPARGTPALTVLLVVALGYAGWLVLFGYYRYLAPIEMVAPLLLTWVVARSLASWRHAHVLAWVLLVLVVACTRAPRWGRAPAEGEYIQLTPAHLPAGAPVVFAGNGPLAFAALVWGEDRDYLRVSGNIQGPDKPPWHQDWRAAAALDEARVDPVAVFQDPPRAMVAHYARFGLDLQVDRCERLRSNLIRPVDPPAWTCPLARVQPARVALGRARAEWLERCSFGGEEPGACRALRAGPIGAAAEGR